MVEKLEDMCPDSYELSDYFETGFKIYGCDNNGFCLSPRDYEICPKYEIKIWDVRQMVEIKTIPKPITDDGIEVCIKFEKSQGIFRYDRNSPELVEEGIKRWIKKELKI